MFAPGPVLVLSGWTSSHPTQSWDFLVFSRGAAMVGWIFISDLFNVT